MHILPTIQSRFCMHSFHAPLQIVNICSGCLLVWQWFDLPCAGPQLGVSMSMTFDSHHTERPSEACLLKVPLVKGARVIC